MDTARKIIGLVIIIFFGLPLLFGIIWAVGMVNATVSPEFLSDLPRDIIAEIPDMADEIFRDARDKNVITDEGTRAWFEAASKTGISPKELMDKTGLLAWMEGELSDALRQIGLVLKGERRPRPILIDLRPLKQALLHPEMGRFFEETLNYLPVCDEAGQKAWQELAERDFGRHRLPACRPTLDVAKEVVSYELTRASQDIENEVEVFEDIEGFRFLPFGLSRTISFLSYFLFLIPAGFIFLGAIVATSSPAGILRWSGASIFAGSIPALLLALGSKYISLWALKFGSFSWHDYETTELADLVVTKLRWIPERILDRLFSPVISVALIACVVGVVLFALSYSARDRVKKVQKPVSPPPTAPAKTEN